VHVREEHEQRLNLKVASRRSMANLQWAVTGMVENNISSLIAPLVDGLSGSAVVRDGQ
jgi:hypothetical protein